MSSGPSTWRERGQSGRLSPDPNLTCAICLGQREDQSFANQCLHQFCFSCLVEWAKVNPVCPLCKQVFSAILHNVRTDDDYDEYKIQIVERDLSASETNDEEDTSSDEDLSALDQHLVDIPLAPSPQPGPSGLCRPVFIISDEEDTSDEEDLIMQVVRPPTPLSDSEEFVTTRYRSRKGKALRKYRQREGGTDGTSSIWMMMENLRRQSKHMFFNDDDMK